MNTKLDLGCGEKCAEGFEGVDVAKLGQEWEIDLTKFPWPFPSGMYTHLRASHFVEHLPARDVERRDIVNPTSNQAHRLLGRDFFFAFFDECYRLLEVGGKMDVIVPSARSNEAYQDPTHRRYIVEATFLYLDREWREANGLGHYKTDANFDVQIGGAVKNLVEGEEPTDREARGQREWNVYAEWRVTLTKRG